LAFPDLHELLARYPTNLQPLSELESLGGAGGYSGAQFWRFRAPAGQLVLRSWPPGWPARSQLERIHHWLALTAGTGFTPVPFRDHRQQTIQEFQGRLWELTPWLPGAADSARPPVFEHIEAAFSGMAALHMRLACESTVGVSPGLTQRRDTVAHLIAGGFDTIESAVSHQATSPAEAAAARRWLLPARSAAPAVREMLDRAARLVLDLQPCLRDARSDHFLFDGDRLSGIVDFGAMDVDCVSGDIARLIGEWAGGPPATRALAQKAYERVRPLAPTEISLIGVFESSADLLIGERWLRWHYLESRVFEDPQAVAKGLARGLKRLERLTLSTSRAPPGP
jgi:Ser/Thr protein kinase RdoA (MazF antagonist)